MALIRNIEFGKPDRDGISEMTITDYDNIKYDFQLTENMKNRIKTEMKWDELMNSSS